MNLENLTIAGFTLEPLSLLLGAVAGMLVAGIIFSWWSRALKQQVALLKDRQEQQSLAQSKVEEERRVLQEKFMFSQQELSRVQTEKQNLQTQITQSRKDLDKIEKKFETQFENLAHKIFDEKTSKFKTQSQETLSLILNPLKDKLNDFHKKVEDSFGKQANEQFALKEQIKSIVEANNKITLQAENLANALKGDSKTQGDWGEVILEKILEDSGLRKDIDYITQGSGLGMTHHETGKIQKPDVIVNLPEGKHVIIDAKVSLTHYERWSGEKDDALRGGHLKQFINSVRQHVKDLENRRYQSTDKLGTPDFVLMFVPIESAYMAALQEDKELHSYAWNKGVAIVCPSTLFTSLRTISSLWRLVLQNQNAEEIAKKGGQLYDKIVGFVQDMQALGKNLKTIETTYDNAMNKLSEGKGDILSRTEALKELGAKAAKSLPSELLNKDNDALLLQKHNDNENKVA